MHIKHKAGFETMKKLGKRGIRNPNDLVFGGEWTYEKLEILKKYMSAFTTALKNKPFHLVYIDAFAGTGKFRFEDRPDAEYTKGSVELALQVNPPFDELIFVEKNHARYLQLKKKLRDRSGCKAVHSDFNQFAQTITWNRSYTRGVIFLDPFGAAVSWSTIKHIADFNAFDMWMLYPASSIIRLFPTNKMPDDARAGWDKKLTDIFGDEDWKNLYHKSPQQKIIGEPDPERAKAEEISGLYKQKLQQLFRDRYLTTTRELKKGNRVLYEFIFCVGNTRGIQLAQKIAKDILKKHAKSDRTKQKTII